MYQFSFGLRADWAPGGWRCTEWILFPNQAQYRRGLQSLSLAVEYAFLPVAPSGPGVPLSAFCFTSSEEFTWGSGPAPWCCIQCNTSCMERHCESPFAQGLSKGERKHMISCDFWLLRVLWGAHPLYAPLNRYATLDIKYSKLLICVILWDFILNEKMFDANVSDLLRCTNLKTMTTMHEKVDN